MDTNRGKVRKGLPVRTQKNGGENIASGELNESVLNEYMTSLLDRLPDIDVTDTASVLSESADDTSMLSSG